MATPNAVTERKVKALVEAGLCYVEVGIQSCVPETLTLFRRTWGGGLDHVKHAANLLSKYPDQITVLYDVIIENPWEPVDHTLQTLNDIVELPRPYLMQLFSLALFPGTELYDRAVQEELISDIHSQIYQRHYQDREFTYFSLVLSLIYRKYPRWLLRLMLKKPMVNLFHQSYMKPFYKVIYESVRILRTVYYRFLCRRKPLPDTPDG